MPRWLPWLLVPALPVVLALRLQRSPVASVVASSPA